MRIRSYCSASCLNDKYKKLLTSFTQAGNGGEPQLVFGNLDYQKILISEKEPFLQQKLKSRQKSLSCNPFQRAIDKKAD